MSNEAAIKHCKDNLKIGFDILSQIALEGDVFKRARLILLLKDTLVGIDSMLKEVKIDDNLRD